MGWSYATAPDTMGSSINPRAVENPDNEDNTFEMESWKKQLDIYWKRRGVYADNKMKLYSFVWGQSTKTTQSKLETHAEFSQCRSSYDSLKLLSS